MRHTTRRNLQVKRIKEEDDIFALVVLQRDLLELSVNDSKAFELGSGLLQVRDRHLRFSCFEGLQNRDNS